MIRYCLVIMVSDVLTVTIETLIDRLASLANVLFVTFIAFYDVNTTMALARDMLSYFIFNPGTCANKIRFVNKIRTCDTGIITWETAHVKNSRSGGKSGGD